MAGSTPRARRAQTRPRPRTSPLVFALRWGMPGIIAIAGVVLILLGHGHVANVHDAASGSVFSSYPTDTRSILSAAGVGTLIIALMVWMVGWFMRLNTADTADRAREEAAREYFTRTGRWPGEPGRGASRP